MGFRVQLRRDGVGYRRMTPSEEPPHSDRPAGLFETTHWSVVLAAARGDSSQSAQALETLCRTYWYPVYAFVRRQSYNPVDAQDLTQAFFARVLQGGFLEAARPERGKFRSFLLTAVRHFLANEWDRGRAEKRGGRFTFIPLDETGAESRYGQVASQDLTPERVYELSWGSMILERVRQRLRAESVARGTVERFDLLEQLLPGEDGNLTQAEAAGVLGVSPGSVKSEVHRLKKRFGQLLRAEIAHTVADATEIDGEIQYLIDVMSRG